MSMKTMSKLLANVQLDLQGNLVKPVRDLCDLIRGMKAKTKVLISASQPMPLCSVGCDASRSGLFVEVMTALRTTKGKFQI